MSLINAYNLPYSMRSNKNEIEPDPKQVDPYEVAVRSKKTGAICAFASSEKAVSAYVNESADGAVVYGIDADDNVFKIGTLQKSVPGFMPSVTPA